MKKVLLWLAGALITSQFLSAQTDSTSLFDVSIEDLMNIQVTSVSKKAEKLQNVPSSIYVISSRDIEKSAAQNLNDLLRENVPGFWSASLGYRKYDTYMRNTFTGSVLVLLDGTPMQDLMSSTFSFNNFDIPLTEIDRIEIIRGSGGTVYGANSATGVISIFTKKVSENAVHAGIQIAGPTYTNVSLSAAKKLSDKFSLRTYAQYNYFGGFKQLDDFESDKPIVKNSLTGDTTTIKNRFSGDRKTQYISIGFNPTWTVTDKLTLSANIHYNKSIADAYVQSFPLANSTLIIDPITGPTPFAKDEVFLNNDDKSRFVANVKAEYAISETNSLFVRASTNSEKSYQILAGGFDNNNSIVDFEIQDNIQLPYNTISVGGNYRAVKYDLTNFYDKKNVNFTNPQNTESLKGLFIQDKISLLNEKLNIYLGLKAENFSLINDKFYLSPMAKLVINPIEKLTLWGGYSKSFTTPGYNQTNIELRLFRMNSVNFFSTVVPLQVYQTAYTMAIQGGADAATANGQALAYLGSTAGQTDIANGVALGVAAYPNEYSFAAINGAKTEPTAMGTIEAGIRFQPFDKLYFESNFYVTSITDGVFNSPYRTDHVASPTVPGEFINAYYYGNYIKGTNTGLETVVKVFPVKGLEIELSHSWFKYDIEFQENSEFDINALPEAEKDLVKKDYPPVPANVYRFKLSYELPSNFAISLSGLTTSAFYNRFGTVEALYENDLQRFDPLYGGDKNRPHKTFYGKNDSRTVLNFRIDKYLMDKKLDVYLWGNDFATTPFVESVNQLATVYPQQVGRLLGLGINYNF